MGNDDALTRSCHHWCIDNDECRKTQNAGLFQKVGCLVKMSEGVSLSGGRGGHRAEHAMPKPDVVVRSNFKRALCFAFSYFHHHKKS